VSNKKCITVAIMFLILSILGCDNISQERINIEVFAVSACPFIMDMEKEIEPFLEEMGHLVDFNIYFYGAEREPGIFSSFHGDHEARLNVIELCIIKYNKKNYNYMKIINCLNSRVNYDDFEETISRLTKTWEECTTKETSINNEKVHECASSKEGINLYRESIANIAKIPDARVPPLVKLNGRRVPSMDTVAFKIESCKYLGDNRLCRGLPECSADSNCPVKEGSRAVCDNSKCTYRNPHKVIIVGPDAEVRINKDVKHFISLLLGELEIEYVEYNSEYGKNLTKEYKIFNLPKSDLSQIPPTILFDESVEETTLWKNEKYIADLVLTKIHDNNYKWGSYSRSLRFIDNVYAEETTLK